MSTPSSSSPTDEKPPSTSHATVSLTLGIASIPLGWLLGYATAIVFGGATILLGSMALRRSRRGQSTPTARKRAVAGLVAAFVGITGPLVLNLLIGPEL